MDIFERIRYMISVHAWNNKGSFPKQIVMGYEEIYEARQSNKSLTHMEMRLDEDGDLLETIFGIKILRVDKKHYLAVGELTRE